MTYKKYFKTTKPKRKHWEKIKNLWLIKEKKQYSQIKYDISYLVNEGGFKIWQFRWIYGAVINQKVKNISSFFKQNKIEKRNGNKVKID